MTHDAWWRQVGGLNNQYHNKDKEQTNLNVCFHTTVMSCSSGSDPVLSSCSSGSACSAVRGGLVHHRKFTWREPVWHRGPFHLLCPAGKIGGDNQATKAATPPPTDRYH